MNAAFSTSQTSPSAFGHARQPNEFDLQRVIRLLEKRVRYRYVTPMVEICDSGYRIQSACCSRNIDAEGGDKFLAQLPYSVRALNDHSLIIEENLTLVGMKVQ